MPGVLVAFAMLSALLLAPAGRPAVAAAARVSIVHASSSLQHPRVTRARLANGLRVVVVEDHALPLAQVSMWYRFGSIDDRAGRTGTAHALEHMMFRGTRALSGSGLDDVDARIGADVNAETDNAMTHYYQTVPVGAVRVAMRIEADRMRGLRLRPQDWALERGAVLTELAGDASSDRERLEEAVHAAAFAGTPYAHDPGGSPDDVRRISVADLRDAYDRGYAPDAATLVVTGDVDAAATVRDAATMFGTIRGHARVASERAPRVQRGFVVRLKARSVRYVDVVLDTHGLAAPDGVAEDIALDLLQPDRGLLDDALVAHGPCDGVDVIDERLPYGGIAHVLCRVRDDTATTDAAPALRRIFRTFARVPASDIANARRDDVANTDFSAAGLDDEASLFGSTIVQTGTDPRELDRQAVHVSDDAVRRVLRRWSTPVGIGIAYGPVDAFRLQRTAVRQARKEHVTPPGAPDPIVEPAWAHADGWRMPAPVPVDAFTMPNGLRLAVVRRPANGTAWVRVRFDDVGRSLPTAGDRRALLRAAEAHTIHLDLGSDAAAHGYASAVGTMLQLVRDCWRGHDPQHGWIAVTGDVDSDAVYATVARTFGAWHARAASASPSPSASPDRVARTMRGALRFSFGPALPRVSTDFIATAPTRDDPDWAAMSVLNSILGADGRFDTRLAREVRERRGLVYETSSTYLPSRGLIQFGFGASRANYAAARAATLAVVDGLSRGPIAPAEVERARRALLARALENQDSPDGVLDMLEDAFRERRAPEDFATLAAAYGSVGVDEVQRVARARLDTTLFSEFDDGLGPARGPARGR